MTASVLPLQELKSHLWNCAQILRGSAVDRTDWKGYILPLLFFKRISDVWDEETDEAREEYGDIDLGDFPELHRFELPDGCHWRDVRETPASVGTALARAMRAIERANPDTLTRVFGAADWGNREMLGDELGVFSTACTLARSRSSPSKRPPSRIWGRRTWPRCRFRSPARAGSLNSLGDYRPLTPRYRLPRAARNAYGH